MNIDFINILNRQNILFRNVTIPKFSYSSNPLLEKTPDNDVFIRTSPNFTSSNRATNSTKRGRFLKGLSNVTDPYSGCKILTKEEFEKYQKTIPYIKDTNKRISHISRYQANMRPVEKRIYLKLVNEIRKHEKEKIVGYDTGILTFSQILKREEPEALKRLAEKERKIFGMVIEETKTMKPENAQKVIELVKKAEATIDNNDHHFQRKEFIQSLLDLREEQKENPHFEYLVGIAHKLPNSHIDEDAFIVKYADRSEEEITNRLVSSSVGTIEHIIPESEGGLNEASNFLLTTAGSNVERDVMLHKDYIKLHPKVPRYTQEYMNDIISAGNKGELQNYEWYPYVVAETIKNNMGFKVNLDKYKIKPKKAFKTFPDRLKPIYPQFKEYFVDITPKQRKINKAKSQAVVSTPIVSPIVKEEIKTITTETKGRSTANGNFLRHIEGVRDPYSGVIILTSKQMENISKDLSKNNAIRKQLRILGNYEDSMLPVEKSAFYLFKEQAKKDKNITFSQILANEKTNCMEGLIKEQNTIFDEIEKEAQKIAPDHKAKVLKELNEARVRISLPNDDKHRFKRKTFIDKIIDIHQDELLEKIELNILKLPNNLKYDALSEYFVAKDAIDYKFYDTNVKGKSPLELVKDLQVKYAPETLNEVNDLEPIINIAKKLPTSRNSLNAFVIKYWDRSDEEIAKRLLNQSVGTIEHIHAHSKGGSNEAANFMLATKSRNEERGNMSFDEFITMYPDIPKYLQEYTDDIINAAHRGKLQDHEWYPYLLKDTIKEETGIDVDISGYKITPEKAFKTLPPRLRDSYPNYLKYIPGPHEAINLNI